MSLTPLLAARYRPNRYAQIGAPRTNTSHSFHMTSGLFAPAWATGALAPPNEETKIGVTNVIYRWACSSPAQRTAIWVGQDMTGHDTTPCTLEEVLSLRGVALSCETPLIWEYVAEVHWTERHASLFLIALEYHTCCTRPPWCAYCWDKLYLHYLG